MIPCIFMFGFGYTANALASPLISNGFRVIGTSRNPDKRHIDHPNMTFVDFNGLTLEHGLSEATHLLISIPPTSAGNDLVLTHYSDLIKKHASSLQWIGYLSSTSVYGDHHGDWVDETSPCIPHTPTGIARLSAEQAWLSFAKEYQLPLHVFRLSGIYGPKRNAIERLVQGKKQSIFKNDQVFCRIHVDDIASTLVASINAPNPLSIYNISDDEPAPAHEVDRYAATLLGREPPSFVAFSEAHLSPMEQEFYSNNRRVSNLKIKKELNVSLKYPTFIEGLTQLWRDNYAPK